MSTQSYILNETVTRVSARVYTLSKYPLLGTQSIFVNGSLKSPGEIDDYGIDDKTIRFNYDISSGDVVTANYMVDIYASDVNAYATTPTVPGRRELINWCLRKLGAPVIDINLDEDQIEDRIDEALRYFRDYHFDGVERCYLHYQITPSYMKLQSAYSGQIEIGTKLLGATSKAEAFAYEKNSDGTMISYRLTNGRYFIPGESVSVNGVANSFTILNSNTAITIGNIDSGYVNVGSKVISISNILPQQSSTIGGNLGGMFDFQYQFALNNMFNLASTDLVTYQIYQTYISMWEFLFRGKRGIRFNKKTDRVYFDMTSLWAGQWIIFEAWVALNPANYQEIYSDEFVRDYSCALLKLQWGQNLKKYSGISLPGGVTLNGQQIYEEAVEELRILRDRVRTEFEFPADFLVG
jgi:hypothetical protein